MTRKVGFAIAIAVLICMFLDNIVFTTFNIAQVRPDMIMTLTVTLGILVGSTRSQIICGSVGLFYDILVGKYFGLNCAIYVVAGLIAGMFFRKFYTDNFVFPAIVTLILSFFREHFLALVAVLGGASFNYGYMLIAYIIPCSIFSAVMCIPLYLILKPLLIRYGKYISDKQGSLL